MRCPSEAARSRVARLCEWAQAEAVPGRLLGWLAVAFALGIAFYFAAEHEPAL